MPGPDLPRFCRSRRGAAALAVIRAGYPRTRNHSSSRLHPVHDLSRSHAQLRLASLWAGSTGFLLGLVFCLFLVSAGR